MGSKVLKFQKTRNSIKKKIIDDLSDMSDISFNTISTTAKNCVDIEMLTPEQTVLQSLKNLLNLPIGGNVLFPSNGQEVGNMLFAPGLFPADAKAYLLSYIGMNEPRIKIHDITATKHVDDFNEQIVTLNVSYSFKNSDEIHNAIVDLKSTIKN